ncbi:MAG TPA: four helix bundle protein [Pyrinomonadaceae bacterium]|nr:four helix bundle protein [Pyrinomonadaceae bacterium]
MEKTNFENLQIYQLSERLADKVWRVVIGWENIGRDTLGKQLVRAVDSVGANIAEGSGRGTDAELRRFLRISRGSLYETKHWLRCAYKRRLLSEKQVAELLPILEELTPKLNAYLRSVGGLKRDRTVRAKEKLAKT